MLSVGLFLTSVVLARAFFFFGDEEPVLFCIKICPLYCTPKSRDDGKSKRDTSSLIYIDDSPYIPYHEGHEDHAYPDEHEVMAYHFDPYYFCKPPSTSTTPAPTTMEPTTEAPSGLCMICMRKCTKYPTMGKS